MRLAGAVFAAQRVNLARAQIEAHSIERDDAAEALGDAAGRQDDVAAHGCGWPCGFGNAAVDLVVGGEPVAYHGVDHVVLRDGDHVEEHRGTSIWPLLTVWRADDDAAFGQALREFARLAPACAAACRSVMVWVPATMRCSATRSASWPVTSTLPARPSSISAWIAPPAVPSLLASIASKFAPSAVIAALTMRFAFSGFQSSAQSSCRTSISPLAISGCEHEVLALLEQRGVVVGLGAVDADDAAPARRRQVLDQEARLQLADVHVVEADVQIEIAVA